MPQQAVHRSNDGRAEVWLVGEGDKVMLHPVEVGPVVEGQWVIREGLKPGYRSRNFSFGDKVTEIKRSKESDFPLPIAPEKWPEFWKHGEWNELRARIEGNPAKITTWIKGVKFLEFQDKEKRMDKGHIALQVHGGGDHTKSFVRYRNVRVKELE